MEFDAPKILVLVGVALALLWSLSVWFLKDWTKRVSQAIERFPSKEWFDSVNSAIARIPTQEFLERLMQQFEQVIRLSERIALLEQRAETLGQKYDKDHERLGRVEDAEDRNTQRWQMYDEEARRSR